MDEESFISGLCSRLPQGPDVAVGPGDDCAALDFGLEDLLLAAADQVVSGVHYLPASTDPAMVARKLLNRNVSDIASMGGLPTHALVTIALRPVDESWLDAFHRGLVETASACGVSIVGGDISSLNSPGQACSLSIFGRCKREKLCLRRNAKPGDALYATGLFGDSFASGRHLSFAPRVKEAQFLAGRFTHAMIDVSDGLLKDARRLAVASGLALKIDVERVPRSPGASLSAALGEGEDYELLFAVDPALAPELERLWPFPETRLSRIGDFIPGTNGGLFAPDGSPISAINCGFDHFHGKDKDNR